MSPVRAIASFFSNWKTIAGGISLLLITVGADGRLTAQKLQTFIVEQTLRDSLQDKRLETLDALALAACLKEDNAIVRDVLQCGMRERRAGIRQ